MIIMAHPKQFDPITNRMISKSCWNGFHQDDQLELAYEECMQVECGCMCHDLPEEDVHGAD